MRLTTLMVFLVSLFSCASAYALTEICGDGVDNDSSGGDALCATPDQDRDGYYSDGTGPNSGTDCNDLDGSQFPGSYSTSGCGSLQYKTCQSDGTYTACASLSSFTAKSCTGNDYWVSPSGSTLAGCGSFANPCNYLCFSNGSLGCYHSLVPGDAIIRRGGNYVSTYNDGGTTRMFFVNNRDGTALCPISDVGAPGETSIVVGQGTAIPKIEAWRVDISDYWIVKDLKINGGYAGTGFYLNGGSNWVVDRVEVYNVDGPALAQGDNVAGFKDNGGSNNYYYHLRAYNNYDRSDPHNQNNYQMVLFSGANNRTYDSIFYTTYSGGAGNPWRYKHGDVNGSAIFSRNVVWGGYQSLVSWDQKATTISNNYLDCTGMTGGGGSRGLGFWNQDLGGTPVFNGSVVEYNTLVNCPFLDFKPDTSTAAIGASALTIRKNIFTDTRNTPYSSDGTTGQVRICHYCDNILYQDIIVGGKINFNNNCYYNSGSADYYFDVFGGSPTAAGATYTTVSAWQAGTGQDAGSFSENPVLDSTGRATSSNCSDKGWRIDAGGPVTTTTTTSLTTTTTTVPTGGNAYVPYLQ